MIFIVKIDYFLLFSLPHKMQEEKSELKLSDWKSEIDVFKKKREEAEKHYTNLLEKTKQQIEKEYFEIEEILTRQKFCAECFPNHVIYYCGSDFMREDELNYKYACRNCPYVIAYIYKWSDQEIKEHERKLNLGEIQYGIN